MKKSEILAIANVKRIADQLRSERNDAWASAQIQRERADRLSALLHEARAVLTRNHESSEVADLVTRIDAALEPTGQP